MRQSAEGIRLSINQGSCWLLLAILLGIPLRFYKLDQPQLWLDELLRLVRFSNSSLWANLADLRQDVAAVPLDYMIQQFVISLFGFSEFAARFHAAFFGSVSIGVIYWLSRQFFSPRTAGISSLLLAVFPLHVSYSREAANYSLFFLLTLLSFGVFLRMLTRRRHRWSIWLCLINVACLYTNYLAITLLATQFLLVGLTSIGRRLFQQNVGLKPVAGFVGGFLASGLIPVALFLPWALWSFESTSATYANVFSESELPLRIFKEISGGGFPLSILLLLFTTAGLHALWTERRRDLMILFLTWFLFPLALILFLDWWRGYFFAIRQILFASPPLLLLAASGIGKLRTSHKPLLAHSALGLWILLGAGKIAVSSVEDQADWKGLNRFLRTNVAGEAMIAAPNIERVITYRYPEMAERQVDLDSLEALLESQDPPRIYLVKSRYTTEMQQAKIVKLLSRDILQPSFEAPGFKVYISK